MDLSAYYPILVIIGVLVLVILLFVLVIAGAFFIGKRKYNRDHGIVKEKKSDEKKENEPVEQKTVNTVSKEEENTVKTEVAEEKTQEIIEGPIIIVDENKIEDDEIIELNPQEKEEINSPSSGEWDDEDLELFEARTYSFDEKTQSGYVQEVNKNAPPVATESDVTAREGHGQSHDPSEDEGVQVFETTENEKTELRETKTPDESRKSNSKYAYFDAVMEKEKTENAYKGWQSSEKKAPPLKKETDYIELDLKDK